jgi:hypothetical protein
MNRQSRMKKEFRLLILVIAILCVVVVTFTFYENHDSEKDDAVKVGDYVKFGRYADESIIWRVIHVDREGNPLLFSDRILTLKAYNTFDYEEYASFGDDGINVYSESTLRQWLNSSEQNIKWWNDRPTAEHTIGYNIEDGQRLQGNFPYADEKGFLAEGNFTTLERSWIQPYTHRVTLSKRGIAKKQGGSQYYNYRVKEDELPLIKDAIQNYEQSYYEEVTDSVFSLSVKQLKEYVHDNQQVLGVDYWSAPLPDKLKSDQVFVDCCSFYIDDDYKDHWPYWLNTVDGSSNSNVLTMDSNEEVWSKGAGSSYNGVRPALYLNIEKVDYDANGNGTLAQPFVPASR